VPALPGQLAQDLKLCTVVAFALCVGTLGRIGQVRSIVRSSRGVTEAAALATYKATVQEGLDKKLRELEVPPTSFPVLYIDALCT
jgi:hypothetical protein